MSDYETRDGRIDLPKLEMALQELEAGTLGPAEREGLMALVHRSPAAQRVYLGYFEISALLKAEASIHAEQGNLPKVARIDAPSRLFRRALLAAAAVVLLTGVVATLIRAAMPEVRELSLTATADARWSVSGRVSDTETQTAVLRDGSNLRVSSGTVELRLESGAAMILQGPANVSFPKLNQPVLKSGWLWIDSGPSGEKFEVHTPALQIRNVGTRFGVRVPSGGDTEVHLIDGKLEIRPEAMPEKVLALTAEPFGLVIPSEGEPMPTALARDPFPEIQSLLMAPAGYATTVLGQNPVSYWRLGEKPGDSADGVLQNEIRGEPAGRFNPREVSPGEGPQPAEGFMGFDDVNPAASLDGGSLSAGLSLGAAPPRHDGVLFHEGFEGQGRLHQRLPVADSAGAAWVAANCFRANGWISSGKASATLAFQPVDGVLYTLDGSFRHVSSPGGDLPWIAIGFASGQSRFARSTARFIGGEVTGRSWMLMRANSLNGQNTTHDVGDATAQVWENWNGGQGGNIDMRIVLDTTRGRGNWTASYFARRPGKGDFIKVGGPRALPHEGIRSVGIAVSGEQVQARVTEFTLRADAVSQDPATFVRAEGPVRMTKGEGAVSCWVRREAGGGSRAILWSAGQDADDDFINLSVDADGRVGFYIENGRYDVLLGSEEKLEEGRWHHVAASWSPNAADVYLDGRRIAWEREGRDMLQGALPELQVGGGLPDKGYSSFRGAIDEVAVWDRALGHAEVDQQVRSGRSKVETKSP